MSRLAALRPILALLRTEGGWPLLGGLALAGVTMLAGMALLGLSGWFITATAIAGLSTTTALSFDVFRPSAGIRFLALARTAGRYGERLTTHEATLRILAALRERLFRGWATAGAARALLARPARLLFRLTADVDALDSLYLRVLVPAGAALAVAVAAGVALGLLQPMLGLALAAWLIMVGFGLPALAARLAGPQARRQAHALESLRARTIDLIAGQTELLLAGRLPAKFQSVAAADRRLALAEDRLHRIETGIGAGFGIAAALALAGTLLAVAALAGAGTIGAPLAAMAVLVAFASVEPFAALRRGSMELGRTLLAAGRLGPRLERIEVPAAPVAPPGGWAVRLDHVTARHDDAPVAAVSDVSLGVALGERVAVLGMSGAGKSTLLGLMAGELAAEAGAVMALPATLLTQRSELFQDSLRQNLRLADPAADDARLWQVLDDAGLGEEFRSLPLGLDTPLGEGGLGLSTGQGRRLALARLLLRDTPLWLLDEPSEGLDQATARDVLRRLADRSTSRAVVLVTHARREAELADRLVLLDRGRIRSVRRRGEPGFMELLEWLRAN